MVITHTGTNVCPIAMLERYLKLVSVSAGQSNSFLFRGITHTKNGTKLREKGGLSYTTICEADFEKLEAIGLHKRQYGLHSLRTGGASAAANAGVPNRMFIKWHRRWRNENAKDGYIEDSLESRLQISKKLGL